MYWPEFTFPPINLWVIGMRTNLIPKPKEARNVPRNYPPKVELVRELVRKHNIG